MPKFKMTLTHIFSDGNTKAARGNAELIVAIINKKLKADFKLKSVRRVKE